MLLYVYFSKKILVIEGSTMAHFLYKGMNLRLIQMHRQYVEVAAFKTMTVNGRCGPKRVQKYLNTK